MKISGKQFKTELQKAEITQVKAAELIGVSRQTLNTWVNSAQLSKGAIDRIKTTLHIDLTSEIGNQLSRESNIAFKETQTDRRSLTSPTDFNQQASFYQELPAKQEKGISHYAKMEEMIDRQQDQIIQLLNMTRQLKDQLQLIKRA